MVEIPNYNPLDCTTIEWGSSAPIECQNQQPFKLQIFLGPSTVFQLPPSPTFNSKKSSLFFGGDKNYGVWNWRFRWETDMVCLVVEKTKACESKTPLSENLAVATIRIALWFAIRLPYDLQFHCPMICNFIAFKAHDKKKGMNVLVFSPRTLFHHGNLRGPPPQEIRP